MVATTRNSREPGIRPPSEAATADQLSTNTAQCRSWQTLLTRAAIHFSVLGPALFLCALGVVITYSVCLPIDGLPERTYWRRQIVFIVGGLVGYTVLAESYIPVAKRILLTLVYTLGCLGLLVLVLAVGSRTGNGLRWLNIFGIVTVQPAEFAKVAMIWVLAECVNLPGGPGRARVLRQQFLSALLVPVPVVLVLMERSLGNAFLLFICAAAVLMTRWFCWQSLLALSIPLAALIAVVELTVPTLRQPPRAVRSERSAGSSEGLIAESPARGLSQREVGSILAPEGADGLFSHCPSRFSCFFSQSGGWNARQALRAVRSGGWSGKGYRQGDITILGFLPRTVQHTDFAYCVLSEAAGMAGGAVVVLVLTLLMVLVLRAGWVCRHPAAWSFSLGFVVLLFAQSVIHIGMALRLLPIIGIPLPFVSYGGSSLVTLFAGLGIVSRYRLVELTRPNGSAADDASVNFR